jgi:hypothetical protein
MISREALQQVAERMARDVAFRRAVVADQAAALAGYDLTEAEQRSLLPDTGGSEIGGGEHMTKAR